VRTTVTLDKDVVRILEDEVGRSGGSFKGAVNNLIREGFNARRNPRRKKKFVVTPIAANLGLGTRYSKVEDLIEAIEGPMHR
jgi:hypothetical protein